MLMIFVDQFILKLVGKGIKTRPKIFNQESDWIILLRRQQTSKSLTITINPQVMQHTMRYLLMAIIPFLAVHAVAQTETVKIFKKTEYSNGNFYRQSYDTIKVAQEPVDIYFFKKHFNFPYDLPGKFTDEALKNRTVSVWRNPNGKKEDKGNWENTYTYDRLGRVTNYTYSGCFLCSNLPYNYSVTYNKDGQIEALNETINNLQSFRFYYDAQGAIVKLEKYISGKLQTELVN